MNEKQALKHTVRYDEGLLKALKDPKEARAYLEVALDECEASGESEGLLLALRDVAQAQGVLVPWRIAPASTANTCTACFQAEASQR